MGGYKIIDLKNTDFTPGTASTVPGIYEAIEHNYRKATLVTNLIISGVEKFAGYVIFNVDNGNYVGTFGTYTITVTHGDAVTITEGA